MAISFPNVFPYEILPVLSVSVNELCTLSDKPNQRDMLLLLCIRYVSCGTYVYTKSMVWGVHQELVRCRVFSRYLDYACISPFALSTYVHHAMESAT